MAAFASYRALLVQIMAGDTEPVGCRLAPVVYFPGFLVMALPTLIVGNLLVFVVSELDGLFPHLQFYDFGAGAIRFVRHAVRCKEKRKKQGQ